MYHEEDEGGSSGVERPAVLIGEDLVIGGVVRPLPLRHFIVDCRDVEDVAECQSQRCNNISTSSNETRLMEYNVRSTSYTRRPIQICLLRTEPKMKSTKKADHTTHSSCTQSLIRIRYSRCHAVAGVGQRLCLTKTDLPDAQRVCG